MYFIKTPFWLKKIYNSYIWSLPVTQKEIFLTFDDGPHVTATPFALSKLKEFNAKATFFCIGKNVLDYPEIYGRILAEGHAVGNHTHNHLNGWKTDVTTYINNISFAQKHIHSRLFRPPYGRIKKKQAKILQASNNDFKIIMWDVLSGDFDTTLTPEKCLTNVTSKTVNGSIVVFHDSTKAFKNMSYALPHTLAFFAAKGYSFRAIPKN